MSLFNELKRRNVFKVAVAYTVAAWVLLQVVDLVLESIHAPAWVMQVFLLIVVLGFLVAVIIAWAYDMTPEGLKRDSEVQREESIAGHTAKKLDKLTAILLVVVVLIVIADRLIPENNDKPEPLASETIVKVEQPVASVEVKTQALADNPSIAVLPFVNMSSDPEQEYFSDGISEEILNVLTRIPNLKVAARTSSFQFKGKTLDVANIGKQLGVNHVLEGSVRKAGKTLRITAQLIETNTGFHLWSETFDRQLEDVFAIQDEIAATIASELRTRFTTRLDKPSTVVDLQAYELYLKGRGLVASRQEAKLFAAIDFLKAALEIEPEYAPAMATLAKAYAVLPWFSSKVPAAAAREQARHWAGKALDIEASNAEALAAMSVVYSQVDLNWVAAQRALEKALQVNPGSVAANNFMGDLATRSGDFDNAMKYESRAVELDPLGTVQLTDLSHVYSFKRDYREVINLAKRALALDPIFYRAHRRLAEAYFSLGDIDQLEALARTLGDLPNAPAHITEVIAFKLSIARGELEQARAALTHRVQLVKSGQTPAAWVAEDAVVVGDFDTAGELLLQAYAEKDGSWIFPLFIRLPEQAPDSEPWQEFWALPGVAELADIRRSHGMSITGLGFGEGAIQ